MTCLFRLTRPCLEGMEDMSVENKKAADLYEASTAIESLSEDQLQQLLLQLGIQVCIYN